MTHIQDRLKARAAIEGSSPKLTPEQVQTVRTALNAHPDWSHVYLFNDGSIEGPDCGLSVEGSRQEGINQINTRGIPVLVGRGHSQIVTDKPPAEKVREYINAHLRPHIDKYGATVVSIDAEAHLRAKDLEVFYPLTIAKDGHEIKLSGGDLRPDVIVWFLRHWAEIQQIVVDLMPVAAPFYSDVTMAFKAKFPRATASDTRIAYSFVCAQLRKAGKIITGD